ncbi:MAG: FAD-dependent oxidoreductase [Oscillospiraceae bacterium]|nr:FAD-dependent oxidoreductase [Oscillospiraceae bacterium]
MKEVNYNTNISLYGEYDIVVIGGGPSGVCAAVASARQGMKVLLVESTGMLGGMATSGLVGPFMTNYDRDGKEKTVSGLFDEIVSRLEKFSAVIAPEKVDAPSLYTSFISRYHRKLTPFNPFYLQIVLDDMVSEAGVEVLCYTKFADCVLEDGQIKYVILAAPEGMLCATAKTFIDCSGIAAVAARANVPTYKGSEESGVPQPATLMFEVDGVDTEKYAEYAARPEYPVKAYLMPTSKRYKVNHYHVFSVDAANAKSLTDGHKSARRQVLDAYSVLKDKTPGFERAEITNVASVLGVRECRHIEGEYKITVNDVVEGTKFNDRIAVYGYGMDVHRRSEKESGNFKVEVANRYYIPYRSLLPKNCSNLLVAGKTICCESQAVGGMRCMPAAMAMGQAAGTAAAIAAKNGKPLRDIDINELQQQLIKDGVILD